MHQRLSTTDVPESQRLDYWRDLVCDTYFNLDCTPPDGQREIQGLIEARHVASTLWSRIAGSAQNVRRTSQHVARSSGDDGFIVSVLMQGSCVASQDGRQSLMKPGDFVLVDATRPYGLDYSGDFDLFCIMLPGPSTRSTLKHSERLTASAVDGRRGAGQLLINMIQTLGNEANGLAPASALAVSESLLHILLAGLSTLPEAQRAARSHRTAYLREQIRQLVRQRLRDPALDISAIAQQMRVSASTLHRAWTDEPSGLSEWIWSQRLDAARRDLADPAQAARSVSEIAFDCGFNDAAHFSRAFRSRFGCSPSEARGLKGSHQAASS